MDKYIPGWSGLNWKGKGAKVQQYFNLGRSEIGQWERLAYIPAGLWTLRATKALDITDWQIVLISLAAMLGYVLFYFLFAVIWVRLGWFKHGQAVSGADGWSPQTNLTMQMLVNICHALNVSVCEQDAHTAPPEVKHVLQRHSKQTQDPHA